MGSFLLEFPTQTSDIYRAGYSPFAIIQLTKEAASRKETAFVLPFGFACLGATATKCEARRRPSEKGSFEGARAKARARRARQRPRAQLKRINKERPSCPKRSFCLVGLARLSALALERKARNAEEEQKPARRFRDGLPGNGGRANCRSEDLGVHITDGDISI